MNLKTSIELTPLLDTLRLQKISDEEYFSTKYSDYISNSRLGLITQEDGLQKFIDGFAGNRIFSDSLTLGTVVHEQSLQPELFDLCPDLDRPTAKVGFIADELSKTSKDMTNFTEEEFLQACATVDYYKGNPSSAKRAEILPKIKEYLVRLNQFLQNGTRVSTFLDSKNREKAIACIEALRKNKDIQKLLHPTGIIEDPISECEQAILLDVKVKAPDLPEFTVRLKSKVDNYTIDKDSKIITVNDVKTIGRMVTEENCVDQIQKYHYYRELYMYGYLLTACAKKFYGLDEAAVKGNFLWVSTVPNYYTKVTPMTKKLFTQGREEFQELLRKAAIAIHFKNAVSANEYFASL